MVVEIVILTTSPILTPLVTKVSPVLVSVALLVAAPVAATVVAVDPETNNLPGFGIVAAFDESTVVAIVVGKTFIALSVCSF